MLTHMRMRRVGICAAVLVAVVASRFSSPTLPVSSRTSADDAPLPGPSGDPYLADLRQRDLLLPVRGVKTTSLSDTFGAPRDAARRHEALDILAPRGTPVQAVESGTIEKLFTSVNGGLTIYEFDPTRRFCYYYAHLDGYAPGLAEHHSVERGQVLGYVGTTGNAPKNTPHLHFGVSVLTPKKEWWKGDAVDPYLIWRNKK
jgi:murein DD-endopeptidase MepM/ murein hydrolase activator NlpD